MRTPTIEERLSQRQRPTTRAPAMYQRWEELLFLHWAFDPEVVQRSLPEGLRVDTFEDRAWVGVVPFHMRGIRPRGVPSLPWISYFLELNLRTYVLDRGGIPGVWFYSLDANRRLAVWSARTFFNLPYFNATMAAAGDADQGWKSYSSRRRGVPAELTCRSRFRTRGDAREATPGSLEFFLVERYVLFARDVAGRLQTGRVHHEPYRLREVELDVWDTNLVRLGGLPAPDRAPDHAIAADKVQVEVFALERPLAGE